MRVLSTLNSLDFSDGGPPEVLRNQLNVINHNRRLVSILKMRMISISYLIKCILIKSYRIKLNKFLNKFDIIHFHELWTLKPILILYCSNKLGIKHFYVGHGYLDTWSINQGILKKKLFIKLFLQYAFNSASATFFSTHEEYLEAKNNIKVHNTFIIPNGINLNLYKKRILENKSKKKILFFGRIHKKKGLEILINAIKKLPKDFFDEFSFDITGPGEIKDISDIKKKIKENNLLEKIKVNQPISRENKIEYLKKFDLFILPSFEEGDSIALKEALASYLPVIISEQCRMKIVQKYNAGLVTKTNSLDLYNCLIKLKELDIKEMGYQARKLIENHYDNLNCSNRLLKIYYDIHCGTRVSEDWINEKR